MALLCDRCGFDYDPPVCHRCPREPRESFVRRALRKVAVLLDRIGQHSKSDDLDMWLDGATQGPAYPTSPPVGLNGCRCGLGPRVHSTGCPAYRRREP